MCFLYIIKVEELNMIFSVSACERFIQFYFDDYGIKFVLLVKLLLITPKPITGYTADTRYQKLTPKCLPC